jgi:transcriptional regulator with XRE-family HTH domain
MRFGEMLRQLRLDLGLTQQNIAERTHVSVSYIRKVENERLHFGDYPSETFIQRLAELPTADEDHLLLADVVPAGMRIRISQPPELFRKGQRIRRMVGSGRRTFCSGCS